MKRRDLEFRFRVTFGLATNAKGRPSGTKLIQIHTLMRALRERGIRTGSIGTAQSVMKNGEQLLKLTAAITKDGSLRRFETLWVNKDQEVVDHRTQEANFRVNKHVFSPKGRDPRVDTGDYLE